MTSTAVSATRSMVEARERRTVRHFPEATHTLTSQQVQAIRDTMRLFVEEDLSRGTAHSTRRLCTRCEQDRPGAGFIAYEGSDLCNPCATVFELARARGVVRSLPEFLRVL